MVPNHGWVSYEWNEESKIDTDSTCSHYSALSIYYALLRFNSIEIREIKFVDFRIECNTTSYTMINDRNTTKNCWIDISYQVEYIHLYRFTWNNIVEFCLGDIRVQEAGSARNYPYLWILDQSKRLLTTLEYEWNKFCYFRLN